MEVIPAVVEEFLPLPHHAKVAVVDDGDLDVDLFLHDRGEFRHGHLESAVAHDDPYFRFGPGEFRADRCGKSEPHRAETARRDQSARPIVPVILRFPHLVLAHIGDDDASPWSRATIR